MRYARTKQYGAEVRIVDVVEIPSRLPAWAANAEAFLEKMFPGYTGWFLLQQDVTNGAVEQANGSFVQPDISLPSTHRVLDGRRLRKLVIAAWGGNGAAAAKLQIYIDAAEADTDQTNAGKIRRLSLGTLRKENEFTKSDADELMSGLQFLPQDKNAVLMAWPESP